MRIEYKEEVVEYRPAFIVKRREAAVGFEKEGMTVLYGGERLGLKKAHPRGDYFKEYFINSVVSYALETDRDPIEMLEDAKARKHQLHWISSSGSCISDSKREPVTLIEVFVGMKVWFEGRPFEIVEAPNNNLDLKPIVA